MKRRKEEVDQSVDQHLRLFSAPPAQEIDDAKERTRRRLSMQPVGEANELPAEYGARRSLWKWRLGLVGAVAAVALAVVFMPRGIDARAVVEAADGGLSDDSGRVLQAGEKIEAGSVLRANGSGAMLKLADGSHVEMRGNSKLSLERADDGVRVQLSDGDVIVNASKQHGHLYVQTKDVNVSVIGTVFLVKSEETGSRVAVIEGEVRVQQGTTDKNLRPGEQVNTNPLVALQPVSQEIAWSSKAPEHIALLQLSAPLSPPRVAFEEASIRPSGPAGGGGGRGGGTGTFDRCTDSHIDIDPHRFAVTKVSLYSLITMAYNLGASAGGMGMGCVNAIETNRLSGLPDWGADRFDIQAVIPDGPLDPPTTVMGYVTEPGPRVQKMLQTLLAERFKLVLRREMKETPVYVLTVPRGGSKLTAWSEGARVSAGGFGYGPSRDGKQLATRIIGNKAPLSQLVSSLESVIHRPVLDRTGITGEFVYYVEFAFALDQPPAGSTLPVMTSPSVSTALQEQLGLELKSDKAPVEVLVVEHVEKPSEN